jgi:hypothetical protein
MNEWRRDYLAMKNSRLLVSQMLNWLNELSRMEWQGKKGKKPLVGDFGGGDVSFWTKGEAAQNGALQPQRRAEKRGRGGGWFALSAAGRIVRLSSSAF